MRWQSEDLIQEAIVDYLEILERQGFLAFFAVPNGEKRHKATAAKLKVLGVRAGIPDIVILPMWKTQYGARPIFIEVKAPKGVLSGSQKHWHSWLENNTYEVCVVRSIDDVKRLLELKGVI